MRLLCRIVLVLIAASNAYGSARTWQDVIGQYCKLLTVSECDLLQQQYNAYINKKAPIIADAVIKDIPLQESDEQLVDIKKKKNPRISMLPAPPANMPFLGPSYSSGVYHASLIREGVYHKLELMVQNLDWLAPYFGYQPGDIDIKVFDAWRPVKAQQTLFDNRLQRTIQSNPHLSCEEAEHEVGKWLAPVKDNIPTHSTGAAIDIRLWNNKTNEFLDMGMFGVIWNKNPQAPSFCEEIGEQQKLNRLFMITAALKAELINYVYEHWHFSYGDKYAEYWAKSYAARKARYGIIEPKRWGG